MTEATQFGVGALLLAALLSAILFQTNYRKAETMFKNAIPASVKNTIARTIQLAALKAVVTYIDQLMALEPDAREAKLATMRRAVETGDLSLVGDAVTFNL
jgi:hypothetical protein